MPAIVVFLFVNLYLGHHMVSHYKEFRLKNSPISIKDIREIPPRVVPVDMDGDGDDEVMFTRTPEASQQKEIEFLDPDPSAKIVGCQGLKVPKSYLLFDACYNETLETCVFKFFDTQDGHLILRELDNNGTTLDSIEFEGFERKLTGDGTGFVVGPREDLDGDGKEELLIRLVSFYKHSPRGVVCFNPATGQLIWEYYGGTLFNGIQCRDLDGNGTKEVILSTSGISNGAELYGTSDAFSYVIVLDHRGKMLWKRTTGEWYTQAMSSVSDLDNDGTYEIVTATGCHRARATVTGKLFIFDGVTGTEKASFSLETSSFSNPVVLKPPKSPTRICVGDSGGFIRVFDQQLKFIKIIKEDRPVEMTKPAVYPGDWPFVFVDTTDRLMAFDMELERKVFSFRFEQDTFRYIGIPSSSFTPLRTLKGKRKYALVGSNKLYQVSQRSVSPVNTLKNLAGSSLLVTLAVLVLFNGVFVFFVYRSRSDAKRSPGEKASYEPGTSRFIKILRGIAHQVKNPLATVLWTAEKIERESAAIKEKETGENYRQLARLLAEDVETLHRQTQQILDLMNIRHPVFGEERQGK
ncbi:MAG: hypothetical protein GY940_45505 [bacterium]|nr:hypothetical protein [bacterium]